MATPPFVSPDDAAAAIKRIHRRHRRVDRPNQHLLTDDPYEVIRYLRGCGSDGLIEDRDDVDLEEGDRRSHDLEDLLVLRVFLWWEGQRAEKWALEAAEKIRFDRKRVGRLLGIGTGQGVHDRLDRLIGLFSAARRPHQRVARIDRGTAAGSQLPATPPPAPAATAGLRAALAVVLGHLDDFPAETIDELVPLRRETTSRAELSDRELVGDLGLILSDLVDVDLPAETREALQAVEEIIIAARA